MKQILPRFGQYLTAVLLFLTMSTLGWGQVNINPSSPYSQDFNSLTSAGSWTNNSTLLGWYVRTTVTASITTFALNTGLTTTGAFYSFGSTGNNDRAIGHSTSNAYTGSAGSGLNLMGLRLKNNSGATIDKVTIKYDGEQWRRDNTVAQSLNVSYKIENSATDLTSGTWTNVSALKFDSPNIVGTATALDGNNSTNRQAEITAEINVTILDGQEILIRWVDLNDSGNDHHLAIDNVNVSVTTLPTNVAPVASSVAISGTLNIGETLTGSYNYTDADTDTEGASTYKWYRADDASGTNAAPISGAAATTYILQAADVNKYIRFGVVPVASAGTSPGVEAFSSWQGPVVDASLPLFTLTSDSALTEQNLSSALLTVSLSNVTFVDGVLDVANFTLNNAPTGLTIDEVVYDTPTSAIISLLYDQTDFDTSISNFSVSIAAAELSSAQNLTSSNLSISAVTETLTVSAINSFGSKCLNSETTEFFTVEGSNLKSGNISLASLTGFTYSLDNITFTSTVSIPSSGGTLAATTVYVKFTPVLVQNYDGNIVVSGVGAPSVNRSVVGSGVNSPPSITTPTSTSITLNSVTLGGTITDLGCTNVTERGIYYSTTNGFADGAGTKVSETGASFTTGAFTINVSGLLSGTTYYYKAFATSSAGTQYTIQSSFNTLSTNANLTSLSISTGTLTPSFDAATTAYTASVASGTTSMTVTPAAQATATIQVRINGGTYATVSSGTASSSLALNVGTNTVEVLVTAQDGVTTKLYTITVTRPVPPVVIAVQDFETSPASPTWSYTGGGSVNTTTGKFNGASSYRISSSQTLTMNNVDISGYTNVQLSVAYAATGPDSLEDLFMDISYDNGVSWEGTGSIKLVDGFNNTNLNINTVNSSGPTTQASNPWVTSIEAPQTQISVRFRIDSPSGATEYYFIDDVTLTGNLNTDPIIVVTPSILSNFSQTTFDPSAEQIFSVSGDNLTDNVLITPPTGYEISTSSGGAFSAVNPVSLSVSGGNVENEPVNIYVRQVATLLGTISGNISLTSTGASTKNVAVSGIRTARFYSKATGDLNDLATWGVDTDGTGATPANFTSDGATYEIRNRTTASLNGNWAVSGAASKVVVGDGTNAINFTIPSAFSFIGTIDVSNQATLTVQNTTLPTLGTLSTGSMVDFNNIAVTIPNAVSYSNLKLSGTGLKTFAGNTTTVAGNLTLDNTAFTGASSSPFSTIDLAGNLDYIGTITSPADNNSITLETFGTAGGIQAINANNNMVRWFRITTTTANTVDINNASNVYLGNSSGGGITLVNGSVLDLSGDNFQLFDSNSTSSAFILNTSGTVAVDETTTFLIERSGSSNLGTLRFKSDSNTIGSFVYNHKGATNTLTLANPLIVADVLDLQDGTLNVTNLVLKSTSTGTARVAPIGSGASITGDVIAERYIPARRAWRLLTAPIKGTTNTSIFTNWQGTNNEGILLWNPNGGGATGLEVGPQSNIFSYNGGWAAVNNTNTTPLFGATQNNAFLVFATGPHGSANITPGADPTTPATATTLRPKGGLITGTVTTTLTANQFQLIGNPYASALDTEALIGSNPDAKIWMLDPTLGSFGGYVTYDGTNWAPSTPATVDKNIQSGQGFFVRSASTSFAINEAHKVSGSSDTWFARDAAPLSADKIRVLLYKQEAGNWKLADGVLSVHSSVGNDAVDAADANKISNFNENIAFRNGATNLAIEYRGMPEAGTQQPLRMTGTTAQPYQLRVRTEGYVNSTLQPYLEDIASGTLTAISTDGSDLIVSFTGIVATTSTPDNRFRIVYPATLGLDDIMALPVSVYPNPVTEGAFTVLLKETTAAQYALVNVLGQEVQKGTLSSLHNTIPVGTLQHGIYVLQVRQEGKVFTTKLILK